MNFGFWAALWFFDVFHDSKKVTSTALEVKRLKRWLHTVTASRHLPISWASRCAVLLRTRSQFTWGTGSHSLVMTSSHNNELNTLRSGILRCLLRRGKYVCQSWHLLRSFGFSFSLPNSVALWMVLSPFGVLCVQVIGGLLSLQLSFPLNLRLLMVLSLFCGRWILWTILLVSLLLCFRTAMWISTNGFMKRVALGGMLSLSKFPETVLFFALLKLVFCEMRWNLGAFISTSARWLVCRQCWPQPLSRGLPATCRYSSIAFKWWFVHA